MNDNLNQSPEVTSEVTSEDSSKKLRVAVVGGGPGGYAAAFLAADLGMQVTLIDSRGESRRRLSLSRLHSFQGAAARRQAD